MSSAAPPPERRLIAGPAGPLEIVYETAADARALVVVCHPHPLYGGTLDNKVVHTLARAALGCGAHALRFNFRGVGRSAGVHDEGRGELDDLLAAVDWGRARAPELPLHLAGFSFGSAVALAAALRAQADSVLLVAPPVGRLPVPAAGTAAVPLHVVHGTEDELVALADVQAWAGATPLTTIREATHFFHGRLPALREAAQAFWCERFAGDA